MCLKWGGVVVISEPNHDNHNNSHMTKKMVEWVCRPHTHAYDQTKHTNSKAMRVCKHEEKLEVSNAAGTQTNKQNIKKSVTRRSDDKREEKNLESTSKKNAWVMEYESGEETKNRQVIQKRLID